MGERPRLARSAGPRPSVGIAHIGPGAFFRAFVATYCADAMAAAGGDWAIRAVSLNSASARDQLEPQGGAFSAVTLAPDGQTSRLVEAIDSVLVAAENPAAAIEALSDPGVRIVSLTITEKGYRHDAASGRLRIDDPDVAHDLANLERPRTAVGLLVAALARRRAAGRRPFTALSCDNLPKNGALLRRLTLDFAAALDPELAAWIGAEARFPSTMVDRITPAATPADIERLAAESGVWDRACVFHEPFRQWVVEDDFVDGARPAWEAVGADLVGDVAPFEEMKLRCLNGAHSALAYLGYLAGHATVSDVLGAAPFARYCRALWRLEIIPTVTPPPDVDVDGYCDRLFERFQNPAIRHRTWQIAMDGSQKLPQRLLRPIEEAVAAGRPWPRLALAVAGWMRYVAGVDDAGASIEVRDPLIDRIRGAIAGAGGPEALLNLKEVFPPAFPSDRRFVAPIVEAYRTLSAAGAAAAVSAVGD